ncbi:MAG: hypothetical protein ACYC0H_19935, partial [Solirubrobacteraceae bacterium]
MSPSSQSRRRRVEQGIYVRLDANGADVLKGGKLVYEIGYRDAQGKQRWRVVEGGIPAARSALAQAHSDRARGVRTAVDPRMTFNAAADAWWAARVERMRPTTRGTYRS